MDPSIERAIAERARSQLGLLTRSQALAAGMSRAVVARRCAAGLWDLRGAHVLWPTGLDDDPRRRVLAACLDVGGVASHRTAAWLHGLDAFGAPERPEVLVAVQRTSSTPLARVHRTTDLPLEDVLQVGPVPTTSIARTLLDLAKLVLHHELDRERLVGALEAAVRERQASDRWLWWLLEERRRRGRDGVSVMEEVLAERARLGPTESWLERETLRILDAAGLPLPRVQARIRRRGAFVSRVDLAYDHERIAIEVEGRHHLTEEQQAIDARQRNELQLLGYVILTFKYRDVVGRPEVVVRSVRRALLARAA